MANNYNHFLNINNIKLNSTIGDNKGLPFTDRFVCLLNAPLTKNEWLEFQVMAAEVPNFGVDPTELELNGARRFYFKNRTDSELSITFLETPDLLLRRFFFQWMNKAISIDEGLGVKRNYMDTYVATEFLIFPLDYNGDANYADKFVNVFPYDISNIAYNYSQAGELLKTTVKFKYMFHSMINLTSKKDTHLSEKSDYQTNFDREN